MPSWATVEGRALLIGPDDPHPQIDADQLLRQGRRPRLPLRLVELLDLYPTTAKLCGLDVPARLQGKDISPILDDPQAKVHDTVFSVAGSSKGLMLRDDRWVFIQYGEDAKGGIELFDMQNDPKQLTNLASSLDHVSRVEKWKAKLTAKLAAVRANDLNP